MHEGLLTIAYGSKKYVKMAQSLSRSYRRHDASRPIAIVTDEKNAPTMRRFFDIVIPYRPEYGAGVVQKLHADLYSPFEKTLFVDSDCLFYKSPSRLWDSYAQSDFTVRGWRYLTGKTEYEQERPYEWVENIPDFLRKNDIERVAHFNSGVFYFAKSELATRVFATARSVYERRSSLGFVPFKNAPIADEPAFAVAMETCGVPMYCWDTENGMETAIGIEQMLKMNVLAGKARFVKSGTVRNPALVHFNVGAQDGVTYAREMLRLRHEKQFFRSIVVNGSLLLHIAKMIWRRIKRRGVRPVLVRKAA
jgi:hypothetical protein